MLTYNEHQGAGVVTPETSEARPHMTLNLRQEVRDLSGQFFGHLFGHVMA